MQAPIRHERGTAPITPDGRKGATFKVSHGKVYVLELVGERLIIVPAAGRCDTARPR